MKHMNKVLCALVITCAVHTGALAQTSSDFIPKPGRAAIEKSSDLNAPSSSGHPQIQESLITPSSTGHPSGQESLITPSSTGHPSGQ